jgi:hypothetical protein
LVSSGNSLAWLSALSGAVCVLSACVRDPLSGSCPDIAEGELVVTEVSLGDGDSVHGWIEVFNASDRELPLGELRVTMTPLTGEADKARSFLVRDGELAVAAGAYAVLGQGNPKFYDFIDYDFVDDQGDALEVSASVELRACDTVVDVAAYRDLAPGASLALAGDAAPDPDANDDSAAGWCVDASIHQSAPDKQSTRGTPGEANPPCSA